MISTLITQRHLNLALFSFAFLFFIIPVAETSLCVFPLASLIFSLVLIANARILPLSAKYRWSFIALAALAYCFDWLLMITFHPLLGVLLVAFVYGIYLFCFGAYIWAIVKNFDSIEHDPKSLLKSGLCAYCLLGFFWMVVYGLVNVLYPMLFFAGPAQGSVPFFYLSFTGLGLFVNSGILATYPIKIQYLLSLEAIVGQVMLFVLAVRLAILSYNYEARR